MQEQIFNSRIIKEINLELGKDLCREAKQELKKKCRSACKGKVLFCLFLQLFHPDQSTSIRQASGFCIRFTSTESFHAAFR